jgi:hypothetical protein
MFLDRTYFTGELALPQLVASAAPAMDVASAAAQIAGEQTLQWFIAKYEPEFLRHLLGYSLYNAFIKGIAESEPLQVWSDLRDRIYMTSGNLKFSPAANYVYWFAMRQAVSQTAMSGEVRHKPDFAGNVSPARKMVTAWNDMVDGVAYVREWIFDYWEDIHAATGDDDTARWSWCRHEFKLVNEFGI